MTKQEKIREGIAKKLAFFACENEWDALTPFKKQVYLGQALVIMEYEASQGVVIKVDEKCKLCGGEGRVPSILGGVAICSRCGNLAYFKEEEPLIKE